MIKFNEEIPERRGNPVTSIRATARTFYFWGNQFVHFLFCTTGMKLTRRFLGRVKLSGWKLAFYPIILFLRADNIPCASTLLMASKILHKDITK
jgi:hypothetical protein